MAKHGGPRPNSGRPRGVASTRTQALVENALKDGITPLEVILNDMRFYHGLAETKLQRLNEAENIKDKAKIFRVVDGFKSKARECAKDAAPYIHPKLANVEAKVTVSNQETALTELE